MFQILTRKHQYKELKSEKVDTHLFTHREHVLSKTVQLEYKSSGDFNLKNINVNLLSSTTHNHSQSLLCCCLVAHTPVLYWLFHTSLLWIKSWLVSILSCRTAWTHTEEISAKNTSGAQDCSAVWTCKELELKLCVREHRLYCDRLEISDVKLRRGTFSVINHMSVYWHVAHAEALLVSALQRSDKPENCFFHRGNIAYD